MFFFTCLKNCLVYFWPFPHIVSTVSVETASCAAFRLECVLRQDTRKSKTLLLQIKRAEEARDPQATSYCLASTNPDAFTIEEITRLDRQRLLVSPQSISLVELYASLLEMVTIMISTADKHAVLFKSEHALARIAFLRVLQQDLQDLVESVEEAAEET